MRIDYLCDSKIFLVVLSECPGMINDTCKCPLYLISIVFSAFLLKLVLICDDTDPSMSLARIRIIFYRHEHRELMEK